MQPETRYARSGDVNIAYQVVGDGPPDLVAADVISHIALEDRGSHELKGIPGEWRLYAVAKTG